ncbi:nucleotidyltransferase domain-containing protein, partial [Mycolicibacterium vaccae]|nr:nucleotidyltransferase domain-containing protein [Mycolicibacterium vaccae]
MTRHGTAADLAAARAALLSYSPNHMDSATLRQAWQELHEFSLALVATGSLGRGELLPHSDLDLLLVHDDMPADAVAQVAELLWYPLWDSN